MKTELYGLCEKVLAERIASIKTQLSELIEGAKNDSKSTAGDKHETARAMMQIEQEKLANQLNLTLAQQQTLSRIDPHIVSEIVNTGSLIETNHGWLYLSIPLGKIQVNQVSVMCLSAQSPLGIKLCGKRVGEKVEMNGTTYSIKVVI